MPATPARSGARVGANDPSTASLTSTSSIPDGVPHELLLQAQADLALGARDTRPLAAPVEGPGPDVVRQREVEDQLQLLSDLVRLDRGERLHAVVEVALHHVRAADVYLFVAAVLEVEDARVLEKAADDAADVDVLAQALHARTKHADAADDEIDLDARLGRRVERVDDTLVGEVVHLHDDPAGPLRRRE